MLCTVYSKSPTYGTCMCAQCTYSAYNMYCICMDRLILDESQATNRSEMQILRSRSENNRVCVPSRTYLTCTPEICVVRSTICAEQSILCQTHLHGCTCRIYILLYTVIVCKIYAQLLIGVLNYLQLLLGVRDKQNAATVLKKKKYRL